MINAVSVIVGPKEGDTPDRAKYSQVISYIFLSLFQLAFCTYIVINAFVWAMIYPLGSNGSNKFIFGKRERGQSGWK